jgi:hypothetical protein
MYPASLNNITVRIQKTTRKIFARLHYYFFAKKFLDRYFTALNSTPETYSTYKHRDFGLSRPIVNFPSQEFQLMKPDLGIVIQGPILRHQNFTYSTILRYLHFFPGAQIVLSTWKGEDIDAFLLVKEQFPNLHVLQLDEPLTSGPSNINYQILSTKAGLLKIKELGLDFVIKSRTDQCIYDPFALDKLRLCLNSYPEIDGIGRIIFLSLNSFLFRLYGPSDMFQFGKTDQVLKYWESPFDMRQKSLNPDSQISLREYSKNEICEVYLCTNYLRNLGFQLDFTMEQNLGFFRDLFIVLDASYVDLLWNKYTFSEDRWATPSFPHKFQEWNFALWSNLNKGFEYLASYDHFLESE